MAIRSRRNQYRGINAHLHSYLQQSPGRWESFHAEHIADLRRAIDAVLPAGYYVLSEQSLQLMEIVAGIPERPTRTKLDVGIYQGQEYAAQRPIATGVVAEPTDTFTVAATLTADDYFQSVVIYQQTADDDLQPVTRIELLSLANKPPGSHALTYAIKRSETLKSGINLIELDYLHERRSPIAVLPSYPDGDADAYPYMILVSNPHPTIETGQTQLYGFHVDDTLPTISIPLAENDVVTFDFDAVYQTTFFDNRYYGERVVDYATEPVNFET
ncbi:MAG: DUF4058 family protein, partial [Chloroflexi bacterium]